MKRTLNISRASIAVFVVLLVVGMTLPLGTVAQSQEEDEPNDTQEAATTVAETSISGEITQQGDTDWFATEFNAGETVSFAVTKSQREPGLKMTLHAPNGSEIANDTANDGVGKAQVSAHAPQSGKYAVKIESVQTEVYEIPYTVYALANEAPPKEQPTESVTGTQQESEPNDKRTNTVPINSEQITGELSHTDDEDWYSFQAKEGQNVSILLTKTTGDSDVLSEIYNPDEYDSRGSYKRIEKDDKRHQVVVPIERTGRHYIRLRSSSVGSIEPIEYTIQLENHLPQQSGASSGSGDDTSQSTESDTADSDDTSQSTNQNTQTESEDEQQESSDTTTDEESVTNLFGPGFTGGGAVVALFVTALFALRRQ